MMAVRLRGTRVLWPLVLMLGLLLAMLPGSARAMDWGPGVVNLSAVGNDSSFPQVTMSADGTRLTAVWVSRRPDVPAEAPYAHVIQTRSSSDGGVTWGPVTDIAITSSGGVDSPQVRASADGLRVVVVWSGAYVDQQHWAPLRSRSSTDGGSTWGPEANIYWSGETDVAMSADGMHLTVAITGVGGLDVVRSADGGATWSSFTAAQLDPSPGYLSLRPRVEMSSNGSRVAATWVRMSTNGTGSVLRAIVSGDGGATWGDPTTLSSPDGESAYYPDLAVSGDGTTVTTAWVLFRSETDTNRVQVRSSGDGGVVWGPVVDLSANGDVGYRANPQVAVSDDRAKVLAFWMGFNSQSGGAGRARSSHDGGATWGPSVNVTGSTLDAGNGRFPNYPDLAMSRDGARATAVWVDCMDPCMEGASVWQNRSRSSSDGGATWGSTMSLTEPWAGDLSNSAGYVPTVATSADGTRAAVTWARLNSGSRLVQASSGIMTGPEVSPTTPPTTTPATPSARAPGKVGSVQAVSRHGKVILRWARPSGEITGFTVQVSSNKKAWKKVGTPKPTKTKFVWKKGKKGKSYFLRVAASNTTMRGPWSRAVRVRVA